AIAARARLRALAVARDPVARRDDPRVAGSRRRAGRPDPRDGRGPGPDRARDPDRGRRGCLAPDLRGRGARVADRGAQLHHRAHARPDPLTSPGVTDAIATDDCAWGAFGAAGSRGSYLPLAGCAAVKKG